METKPWFTSKTIWGAIFLLATTALRSSGVNIDDLSERVVEAIVNGLGLIMVIAGRFTSRTKLSTAAGAKAANAGFVVLLAMLAPLLLGLGGCSSMTPQSKAKWSATGSWLVAKATDVALSTVVAAAQSQGDAGKKANWLDSLGTGLRTQAVASFSGDDVRALVGIWTPDKPHWESLAAQLAGLSKQAAALPPAQRAELLAQGVERAAAAARKGAAE